MSFGYLLNRRTNKFIKEILDGSERGFKFLLCITILIALSVCYPVFHERYTKSIKLKSDIEILNSEINKLKVIKNDIAEMQSVSKTLSNKMLFLDSLILQRLNLIKFIDVLERAIPEEIALISLYKKDNIIHIEGVSEDEESLVFLREYLSKLKLQPAMNINKHDKNNYIQFNISLIKDASKKDRNKL